LKRPIPRLLITFLLTPSSFTAVQALALTQSARISATQRPLLYAVPEQVPESCPITKPPAHPFVPPSPYPSQISPDGFWFGTGKLWTQLPTDGTWKGLSHYRPTDTAFRQKLFWWREGYDWRNDSQPKLKVTGKRLDSTAAPLVSGEHAEAGWKGDSSHAFMVVGIDIPSLGCWKITGRIEDAELSFVIWVAQ
jgi:hypothetical protein